MNSVNKNVLRISTIVDEDHKESTLVSLISMFSPSSVSMPLTIKMNHYINLLHPPYILLSPSNPFEPWKGLTVLEVRDVLLSVLDISFHFISVCQLVNYFHSSNSVVKGLECEKPFPKGIMEPKRFYFLFSLRYCCNWIQDISESSWSTNHHTSFLFTKVLGVAITLSLLILFGTTTIAKSNLLW